MTPLGTVRESRSTAVCPANRLTTRSAVRIAVFMGPKSYSVETGCASPTRAACRVCQDKLAHLTRAGNCRTPAKAASLPSVWGSAGASGPQVHREVIPAQGVVPLGAAIGGLEFLEVPGAAVVLEDRLLIEVGEITHFPNTCCTVPTAATSASTSARVL